MNKKDFAKGVERLINPIDVGSLHFIQAFNKMLPKIIQEKLITSSSKVTPYMGFVVEPYSFFLCYEIENIEMAKSMIPDGFELVKTKVFDTDEPKYYAIFGCIRAHTSAFWGARVEFYIIAEDKETGLLTWLIIDYDSNTISYDKKNGLRSPNSSKSVITINHEGTVYIDIPRDDKSRKLTLDCNIEYGRMRKLDQRLWLEGNLSIGYGRELAQGNAGIFSLKFDPDEVEKALDIPIKDLNMEANTWYPGLFKSTPSEVVCFPYSQHFVSDSPGHASRLKNREELVKASQSVEFDKIKVFSTKSFKTMFIVGSIVSLLTTITLVLLLIVR